MSELVAEFFGRFLFAFAYPPAVDHHIVFVGDAVNANRAEGKGLETHGTSLWGLYAHGAPPEAFDSPFAVRLRV